MDYFPKSQPQSPAARLGIFGLSAGEAYRGVGYVANGTEQSGLTLIHPHYVLMSGALHQRSDDVYALLRQMESRGLLPPWGMVENVTASLDEYLPMIGSLNASFESLGAYHLWAVKTGNPDRVYEAAQTCPPMADAIGKFYPAKRQTVGSRTGRISRGPLQEKAGTTAGPF